MAVRIAIIDGTGVSDDGQYAKDMRDSFCRRAADQLGDSAALYMRGPHMAGMEVAGEAIRAARWLAAQHASDPKARLMLAGYSRGGSAAIMAAEFLQTRSIPIDSMFLFDPVARHIWKGGEVIPANVGFSRTARRSQAVGFVLKYEGTLKTSSWMGDTSNPCRPAFGNTGMGWSGTGDHQPARVFTGSHGALGGVGWGFVKEDRACMGQVSAWMGQIMRQRGLQVDLGPGHLDPTKPETPPTDTKLKNQALDLGLLGESALHRWWSGGPQ